MHRIDQLDGREITILYILYLLASFAYDCISAYKYHDTVGLVHNMVIRLADRRCLSVHYNN